MVEKGLADDQRFSYIVDEGTSELVTYPSELDYSYVLRERPYDETYNALKRSRAYSLSLLDGGLVQMSYRVEGEACVWHRLAYLPSPSLEPYQNDPERYERDVMFAEVMDTRIVTTPLRFDFDPASADSAEHPSSHLTLGQYTNCRIPVSAPVAPDSFVDLILRSFYNTAARRLSESMPRDGPRFPNCLHPDHEPQIHLRVPSRN
ncbi:DUF2290 domain-containing protein [Salsipaludibacter albus]|uniref:DUF2290 domain-containing protein n=1 Tax=Salsipaludibacter albus TaxID=2849650 RepID=UPI003B75CF82